MKKLFYLVALAAAVSFTACGNKGESKGTQNVPAEITAFVEKGNVEMAQRLGDSESLKFQGVSIEGNDIVITAEIDESEIIGVFPSFKEAFELMGVNESYFEEMAKNHIGPKDEEDWAELAALREYKYNVVMRLIGSESGAVMNCKISHEDLPVKE